MPSTRSIRQAFADLVNSLRSLQPPIDAEFNPGTTTEKIKEAELKLGLTFPPQLSELLLIADGQKQQKDDGSDHDLLLPEMRFGVSDDDFSAYSYFCGVDSIVGNTLLNRQVRQIIRSDGFEIDDPEDPYKKFGPVTIHDSIIVISTVDNPAMICVDLDPPPGGTYGQIIALNDQPNSAGVLAADLVEYLDILSAGYRSGRFVRCDKLWTERHY